jgi:hypothetical protein
MANTASKMTALAWIGLSVWVGDVRADRALLEERLRQELAIKLEDVTMAQALDQVGQKAGVKIALSPEAVWKLPEGEQTRLSVTLEGRLAESLEKMLNSFFLRYAVGGDSLTVYPRPELKHIIGRPTAQELTLLTNIYTYPMWVSTSANEMPDRLVQKLFNGLAKEPVAIMPPDEIHAIGVAMYQMMTKSDSSGSPHDPNAPKGDPHARKDTPLTIASILEAVEQFYHGQKTWYIQGPEFPRQVSEIRIVKREEFWQAHLDQIVDVSFENEPGETIIRNLATRADMDLAISYPFGDTLSKALTLQVQNVKLQEALERILSVLGVAWNCNISTGVISLHGWSRLPERPAPPAENESTTDVASAGGYVGKISIPMGGGRYFIEFMLRESDLPEELRKLRRQVMDDVIAELSREGKMKEVLKQFSTPPASK